MTDEQIRDKLLDIDDSDENTLDSWEANFVENVCFAFADRPLTEKQRNAAKKIIEKYS